MTAPKSAGAVSCAAGLMWIASSPALAFHGTADHGVAPLGAILPIVLVVVVGVILLSIWKPQSRKAGKRERSPGQRAAHKKQKRTR